MRIFAKSLLLFALIFLVAYIARAMIVPDVMPIADGEQPSWQIQVAFIIASVQNIGLMGMAIVVLLALSSQLKRPDRAANAR
jgi:hypothetical protein